MRRFLNKLSARFYISLGLVSLMVSLLLLAFFIDLVPDEEKATRQGRAALAESIAAYSTALISRDQVEQLQATLGFVVERNPDLLSAAIRTADGQLLAELGDHSSHWVDTADKSSSAANILVPIFAGEQSWGQAELAFKPLKPAGLSALLHEPQVRLSLFFAVAGFVLFYFYLGRMLKHLDPSRAVPERVRSALDTLAEGLLVMDTEGHIVLANQAFADLVGREQIALTGTMASTLAWDNAQGEKPAANDYPWQQALQTGLPVRNSIMWLTGPDSKRRTFMINCSPILVGKGEYGGVMVSLDDVTLLEEKEIELRKSKKEAESANKAKSDFLANMSHEIRSPMNAILGFTDLLRRGQARSEAEYRRHLDIVHASGTHLLGLINDILDLSKVEAGRLEVERIGCSPYQIAHEVVQAQGVRAAEKRIGIELDCPGLTPASMDTDPARLRQILTNLIGNAIKFTDKGGVKVSLRFVPSRPVAQLQFDVSDSGIGIADEKLESVFEPFVQAEGSINRRFGGTGLGLTISRRFARAMGGEITVKSVPGKGSTFTVTLPAGPIEQVKLLTPAEVSGQQSAATVPVGANWKLPKARVLIVDDGEENRELVRLVLEEAGALTEQAENGRVAVEKALARHYDIILMDLQMPEMDGETATRQLRSHGLATPIVALTAHAMKGFEEEILAAGFTAYIAKPIDLDKLMATVAHLVGGEQVVAALKKPLQVPITTFKGGSVPRAPVVSHLAANARLRPVIGRFVDRLSSQLDAMDGAWQAQDFQTLAELAHWLKGAGGTVGFDVFTEPAKELEKLAKAGEGEGMNQVLGELHDLAARIVRPAIDAGASAPSSVTAELKPQGTDHGS
ncbi:MAG TPA: ATP-binding protein [Rhodocyclaceae bacterium]|nr:ATP-binding protein [Rhodocyclaceae bacterium]